MPEQERAGDAGATQVMLRQHLPLCWLQLSCFGAWIFPSVDLTGKPGQNPIFCVQIPANKCSQWGCSSSALPWAVTPSLTFTSPQPEAIFGIFCYSGAIFCWAGGSQDVALTHQSQHREAQPRELKPRDEQPWGHKYQQKKIGLKQHLNSP